MIWSRRHLLKLTAAGVGVASGGAGLVAAEQHDVDDTDDENGADDDDGADDSDETDGADHFIGDLVDPVFGYALSSDETDDLSLEHVVNVMVEEGDGSHGEFPQEPDESAPGQFVEIPAEFFFDPVGIHVEPESLVHFNDVAGLHTVTAFHEKFSEPEFDVPTRIPEGVPGFTSPPLTAGESWVYEFTTKGVYDYLCFPHLGLGMVGRIVVFDPDEDDIEDDRFEAPSDDELFPNVDRVLSADELDPANIVDSGSVAWSDLSLDT